MKAGVGDPESNSAHSSSPSCSPTSPVWSFHPVGNLFTLGLTTPVTGENALGHSSLKSLGHCFIQSIFKTKGF